MNLRSGDHSVLVSPQGGSILQWQYDEHFILGPTRDVLVAGKLKKRGETHWCYPNFGSVWPKGNNDYRQHGYLRDTVMELEEGRLSESHARFKLVGPEVLTVGLNVDDRGVQTYLSAVNKKKQITPVLPALHPYFAVPPDGMTIFIGSQPLRETDAQAKSQTFQRGRHDELSVHLHGIGIVTMEVSPHCTHVVFWSDDNTKYVCVEPIFGEPGTFGTERGLRLEYNEQAYAVVNFNFKKN